MLVAPSQKTYRIETHSGRPESAGDEDWIKKRSHEQDGHVGLRDVCLDERETLTRAQSKHWRTYQSSEGKKTKELQTHSG